MPNDDGENFAYMPVSLSEHKTSKSGGFLTVRDMLINVLRRIDKGELQNEGARACLIVDRVDPNGGYTHSRLMAGDIPTDTLVSLLEHVKFDVIMQATHREE